MMLFLIQQLALQEVLWSIFNKMTDWNHKNYRYIQMKKVTNNSDPWRFYGGFTFQKIRRIWMTNDSHVNILYTHKVFIHSRSSWHGLWKEGFFTLCFSTGLKIFLVLTYHSYSNNSWGNLFPLSSPNGGALIIQGRYSHSVFKGQVSWFPPVCESKDFFRLCMLKLVCR